MEKSANYNSKGTYRRATPPNPMHGSHRGSIDINMLGKLMLHGVTRDTNSSIYTIKISKLFPNQVGVG